MLSVLGIVIIMSGRYPVFEYLDPEGYFQGWYRLGCHRASMTNIVVPTSIALLCGFSYQALLV